MSGEGLQRTALQSQKAVLLLALKSADTIFWLCMSSGLSQFRRHTEAQVTDRVKLPYYYPYFTDTFLSFQCI